MQSLEGKVALVTGGGRGLGEAVCRLFAAEGAKVYVADIRREAAQEVERALAAEGFSASALELDVGDAEQVDAVIGGVVHDSGRLDVLVNNAGVDFTLPVAELSIEQWDRVLSTNLRGPFLLSKRAFLPMAESGGGAIVNVASTASRRAWANACAYHASKWGLLGLSHALHVEGRKYGIKVTAMISGGLRTPFILDRFPDVDPGVLQDPRAVAEAILFAVKMPAESVIPEMMVLPMRESSWP